MKCPLCDAERAFLYGNVEARVCGECWRKEATCARDLLIRCADYFLGRNANVSSLAQDMKLWEDGELSWKEDA